MQKCIHCRRESEKITKDHVFPSSWYADNTPDNVQRWTVPSCIDCNNLYGKAEMDLLIRMVPCIDESKPEVFGLRNKVYEAFGIGMEDKIDAEEFEKRKALAIKIYRELKPYNDKLKFFPNFGPHKEFPLEIQHAIKISVDLFAPVLKKVFRGAEYKLGNKRIIKPPFELKIYHTEKEIPELEELLNQLGKTKDLGPGFKIERAVSESRLVLYKAVIWGTWIAYGSIHLIEEEKMT